jgi:hypothetical protein
VIGRIEELLKYETAGDPMTGLKWTRKTMDKIAQELKGLGISVSANTVARLLRQMEYSLRVNHKEIAFHSSEDRNEQFVYLSKLRNRFAQQGNPTVSVDTKKKELVGPFKNAGADSSERSRLPFHGRGNGDTVRHLRYGSEPGDGFRWNFPRHPGFCGGIDPQVVGDRRALEVSGGRSAPDLGGWRRKQRSHLSNVEGGHTEETVRPVWNLGYGEPLSHGRVEMESG